MWNPAICAITKTTITIINFLKTISSLQINWINVKFEHAYITAKMMGCFNLTVNHVSCILSSDCLNTFGIPENRVSIALCILHSMVCQVVSLDY